MPNPPKKKSSKFRVAAVDLFCGVGGLTRGLADQGIDVVAGFDIDDDCKFPYEHNNRTKFVKSDVAALSGETLAALYPKKSLRVLVGCAPCQPFSRYTQGLDVKKDEKWNLLHSFARLVKELKPEIVSMENVPNLQRHSIFKRFVAALEKLDYHVSYSVVFCPDYGIPQGRNRLVLLASRCGKIELVKPTHARAEYSTVRVAIGHLPPLKAGEIHESDPLHRSSGLTPLNLKRIKASKPGGTWRDWKSDLVADCHKKKKGKTFPSVYARMKWDSPSPTITTQFFGFGNGRFGHPKQNRAISFREGAILQSFPENYVFVKPGEEFSAKGVGQLIGNAVPVRLGQAIGQSILEHIEKCYG
jgi:DNA (cytosine-5)-methyltransferase 1